MDTTIRKKASYSKEELTQFENESRDLSGLISDYIYENNHVWFGGRDDFCMMDLPAEERFLLSTSYIRNTGKCSIIQD